MSWASWRDLDALAGLLTADSDDERLMRAEVLREVGEFDAAEEALREASGEFGWATEQIR